MPSYKLYYFNSRGNAEVIRIMFAQAGVEYEDVRFTSEQWAEFKPKTPYGVLPVLEVDGTMIPGSRPISRYLGRQWDMEGSDDIASAIVDGAVDAMTDLVQKLAPLFFEKDEEKKAAIKKDLLEKLMPRVLGGLEKRAAANNCAAGWFYGPKVTTADIGFFHAMSYLKLIYPDVLDKYPALKKLTQSVESLPNIAEWIKKRPVTEH